MPKSYWELSDCFFTPDYERLGRNESLLFSLAFTSDRPDFQTRIVWSDNYTDVLL